MISVKVDEVIHHTFVLSDKDEKEVLNYVRRNKDKLSGMDAEEQIKFAVGMLFNYGFITPKRNGNKQTDVEAKEISFPAWVQMTAEEFLEK